MERKEEFYRRTIGKKVETKFCFEIRRCKNS
jgi:hypothetical protein